MSSIEDLPDEIILTILKNIEFGELVFSWSKVSKKFRAISQDKSLWKKVNICDEKIPFFFIQTSHRGWSTSQKYVQNPLVSSRTFFGCQGYFFCPVYSFLLMSNKNLSFLPFKPPIGGGQLPKNVCKILQSLAELFLAASRTFFVRSILSF